MNSKTRPNKKTAIDLTGPDGNAHALLAIGKNAARALNLDWTMIGKEMVAGDYEHLVKTFKKYFGHLYSVKR